MKFIQLLPFICILHCSFAWGQVSKFQQFKAISRPEKCWVVFHPFSASKALLISELARDESRQVIKEKFLHGNGNSGQVDAFRHVFWMAKLTKDIGWRRAKQLGLAHERGNYIAYKKHKNEDGDIPDNRSSEMDLFNNNIGIEIGKITALESIKLRVIESILLGKCKILKKNDKGDFLDVDGNVLSDEILTGTWENKKCLVWSNE
jgi:hypothetical protein